MRAPNRSTPACRRVMAWCRRAPRSASMLPSRKGSRANITSASPTPMPTGPRSPTTSTASRTRRASPATTSRSRPWRTKYWGRSARSRSTTPTSRSASPPMPSARWRARSAICTWPKSCGRTRAGGCAYEARSSGQSRRGGEPKSVARWRADPLRRHDLGALPLPVWGERWGEGVRNLSRDFNPSPHPSPYGRGSRPSLPIVLHSCRWQWSRFRRNFNRNASDLGVHRIGVDDDLRQQREMPRRQRAGEVDGEARVLRGRNLARQHDAAFAVGHEISAFGRRTPERVGRDRLQRLAHDAVAALMLLNEFDVAEQSDPIPLALDLGNETAAPDSVRALGAHAQRIAEIAEGFERHAVGRPAFEPIWAIGHQEVAALFVESLERRPTFASVLRADQQFQRIRPVSFSLEALEQAGKALLVGVGAHEIEPIHATAPSLGLRKRGPAAIDGLLHQHQQMPG